jgi:hypothetical protein
MSNFTFKEMYRTIYLQYNVQTLNNKIRIINLKSNGWGVGGGGGWGQWGGLLEEGDKRDSLMI